MKIPNTPHYAIVEQRTIHHDGDERSRTHPGHGYPAYTEEVSVYRAFESREKWEAEIRSLEAHPYGRVPTYVAMYVTPAKVTPKIDVVLDK